MKYKILKFIYYKIKNCVILKIVFIIRKPSICIIITFWHFSNVNHYHLQYFLFWFHSMLCFPFFHVFHVQFEKCVVPVLPFVYFSSGRYFFFSFFLGLLFLLLRLFNWNHWPNEVADHSKNLESICVF